MSARKKLVIFLYSLLAMLCIIPLIVGIPDNDATPNQPPTLEESISAFHCFGQFSQDFPPYSTNPYQRIYKPATIDDILNTAVTYGINETRKQYPDYKGIINRDSVSTGCKNQVITYFPKFEQYF